MIGLMRQVRTIWWEGMLTPWLPPSAETVVSFRAMPWDLDAQGRLKDRCARRILDLACRRWLAQSGLLVSASAGRALPRFPAVGIGQSLQPWQQLQVVTRFCAVSDGSGYLEHSIRVANLGVVASLRSQLEDVRDTAVMPA